MRGKQQQDCIFGDVPKLLAQDQIICKLIWLGSIQISIVSTGCVWRGNIPLAIHRRGARRPGRARALCWSSSVLSVELSWTQLTPAEGILTWGLRELTSFLQAKGTLPEAAALLTATTMPGMVSGRPLDGSDASYSLLNESPHSPELLLLRSQTTEGIALFLVTSMRISPCTISFTNALHTHTRTRTHTTKEHISPQRQE